MSDREGDDAALWERDRETVGRAMHEAWRQEWIVNGKADHPYDWGKERNLPIRCQREGCTKSHDEHHDWLAPWERLSEVNRWNWLRDYYRTPYEYGLAAGRACSAALIQEAHECITDLLRAIVDVNTRGPDEDNGPELWHLGNVMRVADMTVAALAEALAASGAGDSGGEGL